MFEAPECLERGGDFLVFAARLNQIKTHRSRLAMKFLVDGQKLRASVVSLMTTGMREAPPVRC
jgi:hypothetical protein